MARFDKPPLSVDQQIALLEKRGLRILDRQEAERFLSNISYYRLRGYTWPFQDNTGVDHPFLKDVSLSDIKYRYEFDQKLRSLLFDALELVEVAFRNQLVLQMSMDWGAWWFENGALFRSDQNHIKDLKKLDAQIFRSKEAFIDHHIKKYGSQDRPPAWKCFEIASFGLSSMIFNNLKGELEAKKKICEYFGLSRGGFRILESWMQHFTVVRNICAHHSRLWDRTIKQEPRIGGNTKRLGLNVLPNKRKVYVTFCILSHIHYNLNPTEDFWTRLKSLLDRYNKIPIECMGFPQDWSEEKLWKS